MQHQQGQGKPPLWVGVSLRWETIFSKSDSCLSTDTISKATMGYFWACKVGSLIIIRIFCLCLGWKSIDLFSQITGNMLNQRLCKYKQRIKTLLYDLRFRVSGLFDAFDDDILTLSLSSRSFDAEIQSHGLCDHHQIVQSSRCFFSLPEHLSFGIGLTKPSSQLSHYLIIVISSFETSNISIQILTCPLGSEWAT